MDHAATRLEGRIESVYHPIRGTDAQPLTTNEYAQWKVARVGIDFHVEVVDGHYYSVPYRFARQQVDARMTANTVEVFHRGTRIAAHARSPLKGGHTTLDGHMTPAHQQVTPVLRSVLVEYTRRVFIPRLARVTKNAPA